MKSNDNEKYVCEKDKTHVRQKALKYACKQRQLSQQCYRTLGLFQNGNLKISESNIDFICTETLLEGGKVLSDDFIQAIKNKEANAASDVSCKGEFMTGTWMIEDHYDIASDQNTL